MTALIKKAMEVADAYANAFNACGSSLYNEKTGEARKALEEAISSIRSATKEEDARICAIHSQYPIENYYDRGYSKGRKDAEQAIRASK